MLLVAAVNILTTYKLVIIRVKRMFVLAHLPELRSSILAGYRLS